MSTSKAVIVTGAAGGIGRAACEQLAASGWQVLAVDLDHEKLRWTDTRENVVAFTADITSEADNLSMVDQAEALFGGLDAIILNAAVPMGGTIEDIVWSDFEKVIQINVLGTALGIRSTLPALRRRGGGAILVTSSAHGLTGEVNNCAYVASKHAVVGLVKSVARDVGWEGIRVNAICPGLTRQTSMTRFLEDEQTPPEILQQLTSSIPLQRSAEPQEMAQAMEFLISPAASYITGIALPVDGGAMTGSGLLPPANGR